MHGNTTGDLVGTQLPTVPTDAALITFTVGGNDVGFANVIRLCLSTPYCDVTYSGKEQEIEELKPRLVSAYRSVLDHAQEGRVIVLIYPQIFSGEADEACFAEGTIEGDERNWIRERTAQMEQVMQAAVDEINNPPPHFAASS